MKMKSDIKESEAQLGNAKGLQKINVIAKAFERKELSRKKDEYTAVMEKERVILNDFSALINSAKQLSEKASAQILPTIMYWKNEDGEHCIATNEQVLDAARAI